MHLMEVHGCSQKAVADMRASTDKFVMPKFTRTEIDKALQNTSKDLYLKFRQENLTFDQLKARNAGRRSGGGYVVLDDIRDKLHPSCLTENADKQKLFNELVNDKSAIMRKLEPWEINDRCYKSLTYQNDPERNVSDEQRLRALQKL